MEENYQENVKSNYDEENEDFRLCYESCETCNKGGDWEINNCKTCENNYIKKPDEDETTNCVIICQHYYYYTSSNQYKCTDSPSCPDEYNFLIKITLKNF